MSLDKVRKLEHAKYVRAYATNAKYRMKQSRMNDAVRDLASLGCTGSYLDVGCGQGDMLVKALELGFYSAKGTEIVPSLINEPLVVHAEVHALPFSDKSFDVVSMFDVIEHLIPGDDELACKELRRVARAHILITANNKPSYNKAGEVLHINRRPYEEWDKLFRLWFEGNKVIWLHGEHTYVSEGWRIDL